MSLSFNHRASIAAAIQDLKKDADIPIDVSGLVYMRGEYEDMPEGEAERIIVDVILDHEFVKAQLEENEALWEFVKWMVGKVYYPNRQGVIVPNEFKAMLLTAVEAKYIDQDQ